MMTHSTRDPSATHTIPRNSKSILDLLVKHQSPGKVDTSWSPTCVPSNKIAHTRSRNKIETHIVSDHRSFGTLQVVSNVTNGSSSIRRLAHGMHSQVESQGRGICVTEGRAFAQEQAMRALTRAQEIFDYAVKFHLFKAETCSHGRVDQTHNTCCSCLFLPDLPSRLRVVSAPPPKIVQEYDVRKPGYLCFCECLRNATGAPKTVTAPCSYS